MNESNNLNSNALLTAALMAFNQLQTVKDKLDPEVKDLLNKSAHEVIASAHTFLDACEKAIDSLVATEQNDDNSDGAAHEENQEEDIAGVVKFSVREN